MSYVLCCLVSVTMSSMDIDDGPGDTMWGGSSVKPDKSCQLELGHRHKIGT